MTRTTGATFTVDALRGAGAGAVFAIHGVQIDPIFQACLDLGVRLVDVRHEASAGYAAEAAARTGDGLGVVAVCPGPGFTNVLTSVTNAGLDRTPVVYLVGSNPADQFESRGLQTGIDHAALARPISKWTATVTERHQLGEAVATAIFMATTAPRGPVVLDLAADVLAGDYQPAPRPEVGAPAVGDPDLAATDAGLALLAAADRPAVLLGERPGRAAAGALGRLLDATGMPCFANYGAIGLLDDGDEHWGGTLFQLGRLPDGSRPDAVLAVGVTLGFETPGLRDGGTAWGAELVRVDADAAEIDRLGAPRVGIVADPDAALVTLAERCDGHGWPDRGAWRATVRRALASTRAGLAKLDPSDGTRLHPFAAATAAVEAAVAHGAVLVGDGAVCKHWLHDALQLPAGSQYLTHGRLGCMGTGLGTSIGAAVATGRPVVCVTGDGALGFAVGELEAVVRHGLGVVVVVVNNARWGASMGYQLRNGGPDRVIGTALSDADYHEVMRSFGGEGARVDTLDGLRSALDAALGSGRPSCINVSAHNDGGPAPELPLLMSHP
jgi:acetolactate synthase-1/2/3 large subunit